MRGRCDGFRRWAEQRGRPSKRKASELQPGLKEIEQEEAARNTQELLDVFAAGELVEARGLAGCHL